MDAWIKGDSYKVAKKEVEERSPCKSYTREPADFDGPDFVFFQAHVSELHVTLGFLGGEF